MTTQYPAVPEGFAGSVQQRMRDAGLPAVELVTSQGGASHFGDALAVFRIGPLLLRATRERGLEFIDIGIADEPDRLYQLDDVEIAFGWAAMDDVLGKQHPEKLETVLGRLAARLPALQQALCGDQAPLTRARIKRAEAERGRAFTAKLGGG